MQAFYTVWERAILFYSFYAFHKQLKTNDAWDIFLKIYLEYKEWNDWVYFDDNSLEDWPFYAPLLTAFSCCEKIMIVYNILKYGYNW